MKKFALFLLLALSFNVGAYEIHKFTIEVRYVDDLMQIPINDGYNHPKYLGLGYPDPKTGICTVYVQKPSGADDIYKLEILGHELLHCTDGAYHSAPVIDKPKKN